MKVILFMAQTINGIIARENGKEDFLSDINWDSFCKLAKKKGCFIVGRKTYELVKNWKDFSFKDVKAKKIIVSKKKNLKLNEGFIIVSSPEEAVKKTKSLGFNEVILAGGSGLNSSFLEKGLIDEIIINVEPTILGKGIKLFLERDFEVRLSLVDVKKFSEGIVQLHYVVKS